MQSSRCPAAAIRTSSAHTSPGGAAAGEQSVAFANQQVAGVERDRHAMLDVKRVASIAPLVRVFDVVVHERGLVKALDGDRGPAQRLRERLCRIVLQRLVRARGQKRPPPFAVGGQPASGDAIGLAVRRPEHGVERLGREPGLDLGSQRVEVEPPRAIVAGEVDDVPDPVDVDRGVLAVVLKERNRHARNGRRLHVGERALEHRQAADADDRVDLAGLNQRHDERRPFGHEHGIAEPLGLLLQVLNRAQPALLAEQPELVERRRALVLDPHALGQQQQPAIERHRGQMLGPHLVVDAGCRRSPGTPDRRRPAPPPRRPGRAARRARAAAPASRAARRRSARRWRAVARARRASAGCSLEAAAAASPA